MKDKILAVCRERGDTWADTVQARLLNVHDLHAADAVYHRLCSCTGSQLLYMYYGPVTSYIMTLVHGLDHSQTPCVI